MMNFTKFINLWLLCSLYSGGFINPVICSQKENIKETSAINSTLKVFTIAFKVTERYKEFIEIAKHFNIDIITVGLNEPNLQTLPALDDQNKFRLLLNAFRPYSQRMDISVAYIESDPALFNRDCMKFLLNYKHDYNKNIQSYGNNVTLSKAQGRAPFLDAKVFVGVAMYIFNTIERNYLDLKYADMTRLKKINFLFKPSIEHKAQTTTTTTLFDVWTIQNYRLNGLNGHRKKEKEMTSVRLSEARGMPLITISLLIIKAVPFFDMFLAKIEQIEYPKDRVHLFVYCNQPYHDEMAAAFVEKFKSEYRSIKIFLSTQAIEDRKGRKMALDWTQKTDSDFMFVVEADAHLDDPQLLKELLTINKPLIAPAIGVLTPGKYVSERLEYKFLINRMLLGIWKVFYVTSVYLIERATFPYIDYYVEPHYDPDMALCESLRRANIPMYITNQRSYAHLVNSDDFNVRLPAPDLHTIFSNPYDWSQKYIHPDYKKLLTPHVRIAEPCQDIYWFPLVTDTFCDEFLATVARTNKWQSGAHRSDGFNDPVHTVDVHTYECGLQTFWLKFLKEFIMPMQRKLFQGYVPNMPPRTIRSFLVRYRIGEQTYLRPHHDQSTYTSNLALNRQGVDFIGGGCRFLRYNCTLETRKGWTMLHPGRVTHCHEGAPISKGTRYIFVSFIDP